MKAFSQMRKFKITLREKPDHARPDETIWVARCEVENQLGIHSADYNSANKDPARAVFNLIDYMRRRGIDVPVL